MLSVPSELSYDELKTLVDEASSSTLTFNDEVSNLTEYKQLTPLQRIKFRAQKPITTKKGKTTKKKKKKDFTL